MYAQLINEFAISLDTEFKQLNNVLLDSSNSKKTELLTQIAHHLISSGGKRIRPLMTIATAKLFQSDPIAEEKVIWLASAIEFIHTATLLHDDVVDDSSIRRNKKTANYIWGSKPSILVGDFLFSQSFKQMLKTKNLEILQILANVSAEIAEAEVWQLDLIGKLDLKFEDYISLITAKTANLFAAACECSAILANATKEQSAALRDFGLNLGIIFQIKDDICDYFSNPSSLGKKIGNDFFESKITLPVILILQKASQEDLLILKNILKTEDKTTEQLSQLMEYFEKYSIKEKSESIIERFIVTGLKNLAHVPDSKFKKMFVNLIESYSELDLQRKFINNDESFCIVTR